MITEEQKQSILGNLRQIPIIELTCKKVGISRATFYRWKKEDKEFAKAIDEAISNGEALITDLSEAHLISLIRDMNFQAIQLWLRHHHKKYSEKLDIIANVNVKEEPLTPEQKKLVEKSLTQAGILLKNKSQQNHDTELPNPARGDSPGDTRTDS